MPDKIPKIYILTKNPGQMLIYFLGRDVPSATVLTCTTRVSGSRIPGCYDASPSNGPDEVSVTGVLVM